MSDSKPTDEFVAAEVESYDRRSNARVAVDAKVELEAFAKFLGDTIDLSAGGVMVETHENFEIGSRVDLEMWVPGADEYLDLTGEIRWRDEMEGKYEYGIEFVELSSAQQQQLERVVERCRPETDGS